MTYYNKTYNELNEMARRFLMNEENSGIDTYIQAVGDILESLSPKTTADKSRVNIAKGHLKEIRRYSKRLKEHVRNLEERVQILEEENDSEIVK